jgi:hypothetical protein
MRDDLSLSAVFGLLLVIGIALDLAVGRSLGRWSRRALWTGIAAGWALLLLVLPE